MGVGDDIVSGTQTYGKIRIELQAIITGIISIALAVLFVHLAFFKVWEPVPEGTAPVGSVKQMTKDSALKLTGGACVFFAIFSLISWKLRNNKFFDTVSGVTGIANWVT